MPPFYFRLTVLFIKTWFYADWNSSQLYPCIGLILSFWTDLIKIRAMKSSNKEFDFHADNSIYALPWHYSFVNLSFMHTRASVGPFAWYWFQYHLKLISWQLRLLISSYMLQNRPVLFENSISCRLRFLKAIFCFTLTLFQYSLLYSSLLFSASTMPKLTCISLKSQSYTD